MAQGATQWGRPRRWMGGLRHARYVRRRRTRDRLRGASPMATECP